LRTFVDMLGYPVTNTLMGLGAYPATDRKFLGMLGMHGTIEANNTMQNCDVLLAVGARFDDRVIGNPKHFAQNERKIIHIDIDPSSISKRVKVDVPIVGNVNDVLMELSRAMEALDQKPDQAALKAWWAQIDEWRKKDCLRYDHNSPIIKPQSVVEALWRVTGGDAIVTSDVGQHQMWAAQFYKFRNPRRWLSSSGLGTMGFGLPAAMGVQAAHPGRLVVDIDGDGCMLMNVQELATLHCEKLPVKILLLNNQHLGMVVQWEDRFHGKNRAHTYLGPVDHPEAVGAGAGAHYEETYPNFVQIARGFGIGAAQVRSKKAFPEALKTMLEYDGPYLLDVICPYQEHVLPMIPGGKTVKDIIIE